MRTDRLDICKLVVARLLTMGSTHHRFHVRQRLLAMLAMLDEDEETSIIAMVVDEIRANSKSAFTAEIASNYKLPPPIRAAFREAEAE